MYEMAALLAGEVHYSDIRGIPSCAKLWPLHPLRPVGDCHGIQA